MDRQAEDVIVMARVEALGVLLAVVYDPYGSHVVHYLAGLGVEQVAPAIITPVAAKRKAANANRPGTAARSGLPFQNPGLFFSLPMNEVQLDSAPWRSLSLLHGCCPMLLFALLFELR